MSALAFVDELARRDAAAAAALAEIEVLQASVERLRSRADELADELAAVPGERERRAEAVAGAGNRLSRAVAEREEADRELARAVERGRGQAAAAAPRRAALARNEERLAAAELARLREAAAELERAAAEAAAEARALEREADTLARRLAAVSRISPESAVPPETGLAGIAAWGARARPGLMLLHGSLLAERDAIVREASELGSAVLGQPIGATSVAAVRERLARTANDAP